GRARAGELDRLDRCLGKRSDRGTQSLADRDRQHQRRLADRLAALDHARLGRHRQQLDVELLGALAERRQLVSRGPAGEQPTVVGPQKLLRGQPPEALYEPAFDLTEVDLGRDRVADVVEDVDSAYRKLPGEAVDLDLA